MMVASRAPCQGRRNGACGALAPTSRRDDSDPAHAGAAPPPRTRRPGRAPRPGARPSRDAAHGRPTPAG